MLMAEVKYRLQSHLQFTGTDPMKFRTFAAPSRLPSSGVIVIKSLMTQRV